MYVTSFPVSIFISSSTIKTVLYVLVGSVLRHYCEPTRHDISGDEVGMSGTLGRIAEFDGNKDDWPQYVERLGYFFDANSIMDEKKRVVFLSVVGATTYKTLRNLLFPTKPNEKSYDELIAVLTKHFKPAPSEIVERFKFQSFSEAGRIVCGINDDVLQRRLLAESGLDYGKAVEIALNLETAAQSMKELKSKPDGQTSRVTHSPPQYQVHKTGVASPPQHQVHRASTTSTSNRGSQGKSGPTCYRCGVRGHVVSKCKVDGQRSSLSPVWQERPLATCM